MKRGLLIAEKEPRSRAHLRGFFFAERAQASLSSVYPFISPKPPGVSLSEPLGRGRRVCSALVLSLPTRCLGYAMVPGFGTGVTIRQKPPGGGLA